MNDEQKDRFYESSSSHLADQIKGYNNQVSYAKGKAAGYGNIGLNRTVKSVKSNEDVSSSLDNFLTPISPKIEEVSIKPSPSFDSFMATEEKNTFDEISMNVSREVQSEASVTQADVDEKILKKETTHQFDKKNQELIQAQNKKIDYLEAQVKELLGMIENLQSLPIEGSNTLKELRNKLRALGISEEYIQKLIRKISFEFEGTNTENFDDILDLALNEMMNTVHTKLPLFSDFTDKDHATITLFVSDSTCGQSSMVKKIATLCPDSQIVILGNDNDSRFTTDLLGLNVKIVSTPSEIVTACRKNNSEGINTFVDYRYLSENDNFKKFVKGLKRSFKKVEVFTTISAIHTETYNERALNKYEDVSDGVVVNYIDHCLDYGMLFNLNQKFQDSPFVFYGNGDKVPDDVEAATADRILAGMFRIK